ncbi:MAG: hypothetical protein JO083_00640 [Candidatus Eremiobacteraeota bacterium]|nr:hypothetical protein [Candidatus Eremiobacteraeota bacterium]
MLRRYFPGAPKDVEIDRPPVRMKERRPRELARGDDGSERQPQSKDDAMMRYAAQHVDRRIRHASTMRRVAANAIGLASESAEIHAGAPACHLLGTFQAKDFRGAL